MTEKEVYDLLVETGAIMNGHFRLTSGPIICYEGNARIILKCACLLVANETKDVVP